MKSERVMRLFASPAELIKGDSLAVAESEACQALQAFLCYVNREIVDKQMIQEAVGLWVLEPPANDYDHVMVSVAFRKLMRYMIAMLTDVRGERAIARMMAYELRVMAGGDSKRARVARGILEPVLFEVLHLGAIHEIEAMTEVEFRQAVHGLMPVKQNDDSKEKPFAQKDFLTQCDPLDHDMPNGDGSCPECEDTNCDCEDE